MARIDAWLEVLDTPSPDWPSISHEPGPKSGLTAAQAHTRARVSAWNGGITASPGVRFRGAWRWAAAIALLLAGALATRPVRAWIVAAFRSGPPAAGVSDTTAPAATSMATVTFDADSRHLRIEMDARQAAGDLVLRAGAGGRVEAASSAASAPRNSSSAGVRCTSATARPRRPTTGSSCLHPTNR